jgi:uncharacterized membrane protein YagU involved in acid resistance
MSTRQHAQIAPVGLQHYELGAWIGKGASAGVVAGIVFALFQIGYALLSGQAWSAPLRLIGAVGLGREALQPQYPLLSAAVSGVIIHLLFSVVMGVVFGALVAGLQALAVNPGVLMVSASLFGMLLWLINFYVVAPAAGWEWFPNQTSAFWQGFVAHTFFFGTVVGAWLSQRIEKPKVKGSAPPQR